jgi:ribosomal protein S18 acetylase RimI-like enzyme
MTDLPSVSDRTLAHFFRDTTRRLSGVIEEDDDLLLFDGGSPGTRGAIPLGSSPISGERLATRIETFFERANDYRVTTRSNADDDLESVLVGRGYAPGMDLAGMVLDHVPSGGGPLPTGVTVRMTGDEVVERAFRSIVAEAFPAERESLGRMFADPASLSAPGVVAMVSFVDGEPASAAMAARHDGIAAVDWVSTRPSYRGRGLGAIVTLAVTRAVFAAGDRYAALQAAPDAARLYARLGYREVRRYRWFHGPAAANAAGGRRDD